MLGYDRLVVCRERGGRKMRERERKKKRARERDGRISAWRGEERREEIE